MEKRKIANQDQIKELKNLTGLRFYAAFHVVLYHNLYLSGDTSALGSFFLNIIASGNAAVDFFFILSGFILTYVYYSYIKNKEKIPLRRFFISRVARLYPLYFLGFLIDIPRVCSYFLNNEDGLSNAIKKIIISSFAYLSMLQSWHPRLTPVWNSPAWSLSCEIFFYLLFPAALLFFMKQKRKMSWLITMSAIYSVFYILIDFSNITSVNLPVFKTFWRSFPPLRLNLFLSGIILGLFFVQKSNINKKLQESARFRSSIFWFSTLTLVLVMGLGVYIKSPAFSFFVFPAFSLIIYSAAHGKLLFSSFLLTSRLALLLGASSYGIYILHQPLKNIFALMQIENSPASLLLYSLFVLICSFLAFRWIESPGRNWIKKKFI